MAAFTAPCASTTTTTITTTSAASAAATRAARQRQGGERENGDVGRNTIVEKTHQFFQMCDIESKGFITQRDMQRLTAELPLSAEELENVFNSLDSDGNGYLTLDEFSSGFSEFLFGRKISGAKKNPEEEVQYQTRWEESMARGDEDEEEKHFDMLMDSLGANSVFEDVKTIAVDNSQVALQLWDTAGQERYRSITKQFFRKADGVVVMYDITTVQSFTAVRQWLTSVKEGAGDDIPTLLLGNKLDKEAERQVEKGVGERLAKDCRMTFYECSACSGHNVTEAMIHLARILKEQEDREKEKTVQLLGGPSEKKRSCC